MGCTMANTTAQLTRGFGSSIRRRSHVAVATEPEAENLSTSWTRSHTVDDVVVCSRDGHYVQRKTHYLRKESGERLPFPGLTAARRVLYASLTGMGDSPRHHGFPRR